MKSSMCNSVGLLIVACGILFAGSAKATVWKNYQDESYCLSIAGGKLDYNNALIIWQCSGTLDQSWELTSYNDPAMLYLTYKGLPPISPNAVCAYPNGSTNGAPLYTGDCGVYPWNINIWTPVYAGKDFNNHNCYYFVSGYAQHEHPGVTRVFGVSAALMQNGTPIILWDKFSSGHPDQYWCTY